jgi:hypothetical protein
MDQTIASSLNEIIVQSQNTKEETYAKS